MSEKPVLCSVSLVGVTVHQSSLALACFSIIPKSYSCRSDCEAYGGAKIKQFEHCPYSLHNTSDADANRP